MEKEKRRVLNYAESTPEERKQFYESIVLSDKQCRQFALEIYDTIICDIKAMREKEKTVGDVEK